MDKLSWLIQITKPGDLPMVIAEYLLNDMGVFVKNEYRVPKKNILNTVTGFRIGYVDIPNTDYRMAAKDRNAILWCKVTSATENEPGSIVICGNKNDKITLRFELDQRDTILNYITKKRFEHPLTPEANESAAAWMCWRDDDEWEDITLPLESMVNIELEMKRYLEKEVLNDTVIDVDLLIKFCKNCGNEISTDERFCGKCGNKI